jgi:hypothetical protein
MKIVSKPLKDVLVLEPKVFRRCARLFPESYNERVMPTRAFENISCKTISPYPLATW